MIQGQRHVLNGTILCNEAEDLYYCVVVVLGEPIFMKTRFTSQTVMYTSAELPLAELTLKKHGITKYKRIEMSKSKLTAMVAQEIDFEIHPERYINNQI